MPRQAQNRLAQLVSLFLLTSAVGAGCSTPAPEPSGPVIASLTVSPPVVTPGSVVTLAVVATSPSGAAVTYAWTVPTGWKSIGAPAASSLTLQAPDMFGQTASVSLTVSDKYGQAAATATVSTGQDTAPTASIDVSDATPSVGTAVALTAVANAASGQTLTYAWSIPTRPSASHAGLASATAAMTSFSPDIAGVYVIQLVATDSGGAASTPATVAITVPNSAPDILSVAASASAVAPGASVTLTATAASTDGEPLSYSWSIPAGWSAMSDVTLPTVTVSAPAAFDAQGVAAITVSDGQGKTASAPVTLATVSDQAPQAVIVANPSNARPGNTVTLAAEVSATDGIAVTYAWSLSARPAGSTATLSSATAAQPTFVPDMPGSYSMALVVTDANGLTSAPASLTLPIAGFSAPSVLSLTATPSIVTPGGLTSVQAIATGTDGYPVSYSWTVPAGWTAQGATDGSTLTLQAPARYGQLGQLVLSASDGHGAATSATLVVMTIADTVPVVTVTANPTSPSVGDKVTLQAFVSAAGNQGATETWALVAAPSDSTATLSSSTGIAPTFTPDVAGSRRAERSRQRDDHRKAQPLVPRGRSRARESHRRCAEGR
jgi:hypothetical protein